VASQPDLAEALHALQQLRHHTPAFTEALAKDHDSKKSKILLLTVGIAGGLIPAGGTFFTAVAAAATATTEAAAAGAMAAGVVIATGGVATCCAACQNPVFELSHSEEANNPASV
jgi:hypothetical protein